MFDSTALLDRICVSARSEAVSAAARLDAIGELFRVRLVQHGECADWAVDTSDEVAAEVAAALRTSVAVLFLGAQQPQLRPSHA